MTEPTSPDGQAGAGDPSMEDILASIRRILSEDEATAAEPSRQQPAAAPTKPKSETKPGAAASDVLILDPSMMVPEAKQTPEPAEIEAKAEPEATPAATAATGSSEGLVAPEAAAAAASHVGSLMRTLSAERTMAVQRGGPTIEELVREEIRPLLKQWLDTHLPPLVERLVRIEIERVVGRATS
jgi:cell pole-organizing protein PopZ